MPEMQSKKNILDQALDFVSNRDEKAAAEEAIKRAEEAEKAAAAAKADAAKSEADKAAAQKAAEEARARATAAELKLKEIERQKYFADLAAKGVTPGEALKTIAEHKVVSGDTLGAIALKYYGNAGKPYWMAIYEVNKAVIGDNPNMIKPGQVLKILELPAELKK
jgi:nucleoid-associated protein YgaU